MSSSKDDGGNKKGGNSLRDLQKSHLEKLMANPDKPVPIPERPEGWKPKEPEEFVRFYMGSSAGAGSEVFHVYRHLRRRENIRQQYIQEEAEKEDNELEFQEKLAKNFIEAEERTSKKRAKRLKRKQRKMAKKKLSDDDDETGTDKTSSEKKGQDNADMSNSDKEEEEECHFVIGGR